MKKLVKTNPAAIALIFLVSFGVYSNSLLNDFVYDDQLTVLRNPWIKDIRNIPEIFTSSALGFMEEGGSNYYRPIMHIIYMLDYYLFGLKPWGFHLTNIVFHAGVSVLVFLIASTLYEEAALFRTEKHRGNCCAFVAALLFATHPIHTEAVAWIAAIMEPSFTLFYLLSFYLYMKTNEIYRKKHILSIVFFFLATMCKETAITLPILLMAYDYSFSPSLSLREKGKRYLPYLSVATLYFVIRTYAIGGFAPTKRHPELTDYEYIINIFPLFIKYLKKLIVPLNLNAFHILSPISSIVEWRGLIAITLTLTFISIVYLSRNNRTVFLSLLWMAIPLLPVLYIPAVGENTFAERYLYLPSAGFVIIVSIGVEKVYRLKILGDFTGQAIIASLIIISGLYSIGTIKRNYVWKDGYNLWTDTVRKSPDAHTPHYNLGIAYSDKRFLDDAIKEYVTAIKIDPYYQWAHKTHNNLGHAYFAKGLLDNAAREYIIAIELNPFYEMAYYNLGNTYLEQNRLDEAMDVYIWALKLKPDDAETHYNLGIVYAKKGMIDKATQHHNIALSLKPGLLNGQK